MLANSMRLDSPQTSGLHDAVGPDRAAGPEVVPGPGTLAGSATSDGCVNSADRDRSGGLPTAGRTDQWASLLLVVSATSSNLADGHWQFAIEAADGAVVMEADDDEVGDLNRLTLLAAVRGLEAIDGPARVTLLSHNRYLIRSLTDSLPRWRRTDFVWDHFGRRVEVQHADLWRRIDRALAIHEVQACLLTARRISRPDDRPLSEVTEDGEVAESENSQGHRHGGLRWDPASPRRSIVPAPHFQRRRPPMGSNRSHGSAPPDAAAPSLRPSPTDRLRDWLLRSATLPRR